MSERFNEDLEVPEQIENELKHQKLQKKLSVDEDLRVGFYIQSVFIAFIFIWIFLVAINKLHLSTGSIILLIPIALFCIGFMNAYQIADDEIEDNVFSTTFVTIGLIVSIPLITLFNKDKENKQLTHNVYLAMILTLFSNLHVWMDKSERHACRIIRSCFETMAISLYAYTLTEFFLPL
uniref:Transmembrane protein n=1 Tax=viral metagenome TaxID=1070528 RepID=A0A6C0BFH6_9ZZZZ